MTGTKLPKLEFNKLIEISNEIYHGSEGLSSTKLKPILTTPLDFREHLLKPKKDTQALKDGRMIHLACLEPELFSKIYVCGPCEDKRSKKWKEFEALHKGRELLKPSEWEHYENLSNAFREHPFIKANWKNFKIEKSAYVKHEGLTLKCRPDILLEEYGLCLDLKSCQNPLPTKFSDDIWKYNYHYSAAFYLTVLNKLKNLNIKTFAWVALEKTSPYKIALITPDAEMIEEGYKLFHAAIERYKACKKSNEWPGLPNKFEKVSLKPWQFHAG